jgi:hypothetical protein
MSNGIAKNLDVVREEIYYWRMLMPAHLKTLRDANWADKPHKAVNLITESIRLLPRTLVYSLLAFVVIDGALHAWLWLR